MAFERKKTTYLKGVREAVETFLVSLDDSHDLVYPNGDYVEVGEDDSKRSKLCYYTAWINEDYPVRLVLRDSNTHLSVTPSRVRIHEKGHRAPDDVMEKGELFAKGSEHMLVCPTMKADFEKAFEAYVAAHPFPKKRKASGSRRNSRRGSRRNSRRGSRRNMRKH
jgi:hypothetical protein